MRVAVTLGPVICEVEWEHDSYSTDVLTDMCTRAAHLAATVAADPNMAHLLTRTDDE